MTLSMWRNGLHKFIVVLGFMALFAVASGAVNTPKPLGEASLIGGFYHPLPPLPSPLMIPQCEFRKDSAPFFSFGSVVHFPDLFSNFAHEDFSNY